MTVQMVWFAKELQYFFSNYEDGDEDDYESGQYGD